MEPPPTAVLKKTTLPGVILIVLTLALASGACQRAGDVPAPTSAREPVPVGKHDLAEPPSPDVGASAAAEETKPGGQSPQAGQLQGQGPSGEQQSAPHEAEPSSDTMIGPQGGLPAKEGDLPAEEGDLPAEDEPEGEPPLPPPLVDDPDTLQLLMPPYPVWIDRDRKHVVMVGRVCQRRAPLELFACLKGSKEHESVLVVDTKAYVVHAGLLATGAEPGSPVRFVPEFVPASGTEIEVTVVWEDQWGRRRKARAQDWVRDVAELYTRFEGVVADDFDDELSLDDQFAAFQDMHHPWVFAGSQFLEDDRTGRQYYQADTEGDLICVSNFSSAVLDIPIRSSDSNAALMFETFTERIPPLGTPVTVILTPKLAPPFEEINRSD